MGMINKKAIYCVIDVTNLDLGVLFKGNYWDCESFVDEYDDYQVELEIIHQKDMNEYIEALKKN